MRQIRKMLASHDSSGGSYLIDFLIAFLAGLVVLTIDKIS